MVMTTRWRTGRKVFRTIYRQLPDDPDGDGVLIGLMDTPELARIAALAPELLELARLFIDVADDRRRWPSVATRAQELIDRAGGK
jgi:hypothetical protein